MNTNRKLPVVAPQTDVRILLAASHEAGVTFGKAFNSQPAPVRFSYTPEVFGYLVGEVVKQYNPAERAAFRAGLLSAMMEES